MAYPNFFHRVLKKKTPLKLKRPRFSIKYNFRLLEYQGWEFWDQYCFPSYTRSYIMGQLFYYRHVNFKTSSGASQPTKISTLQTLEQWGWDSLSCKTMPKRPKSWGQKTITAGKLGIYWIDAPLLGPFICFKSHLFEIDK